MLHPDHAQVDHRVAEALELARQAQRLVDQLAALRITGRSGSGAEVVLSHSGSLVDLSVTAALVDRGSGAAPCRQVRAALLEANADAQTRMYDEVARLSADTFGPGSAAAEQVVGQYAGLLGNRTTGLASYDRGRGVLR